MRRHELLAGLHQLLQPRTYFEIGVNAGTSLALSRARSVGVDPAFTVIRELACDVHLIRSTSDEFFARPEPFAHYDEPVVDLAFIDGMHLAEFALRDFINLERYASPTTVVLFDDMLPRSAPEAARGRYTRAWAGDVFKVTQALRDTRPDLTVLEVDTQPTGTLLVLGLNPDDRGLAAAYDQLLPDLAAPDPQQVPVDVLARSRAADPDRLLASNVWARLVDLRARGASPAQVAEAIAGSDLPTTVPAPVG